MNTFQEEEREQMKGITSHHLLLCCSHRLWKRRDGIILGICRIAIVGRDGNKLIFLLCCLQQHQPEHHHILSHCHTTISTVSALEHSEFVQLFLS
jgi:hypothetical protein